MESIQKLKSAFNKDNIYNLFKKITPYFVLLASSLLLFWIWLDFAFITGGDDVATHLSLVTDLVYGFKNGFFYSTNHVYMGIFAYNASLFYGMFPHYLAAILSYFGISIVNSIKIVSILSEFIGAIFTFKLVKLITNRNSYALAGGIAFAFLPYKSFCFFFRFAWSEAFAISLIPIFFYGLYKLLIYDKQTKVSPFIIMTISLAICIMSHPFTAVLTVSFGVIVVLFNIKKIIQKIKDKNIRFFIYLLISIILVIGLVFVFVFPMIQALNSGIYRVSYDEIMWTTLEQVLGRFSQTTQFSGFLNFAWLEQYNISGPTDSAYLWILGLILFPITCFGSFALDLLIQFLYKKYLSNKNNKIIEICYYIFRAVILGLILFVPALLASQRIEVLLALSLYYCLYTLLYIFPLRRLLKRKDNNDIENTKSIKEEYKEILPNIVGAVVIIIIGFLYLYTSFIWKISPSFFYKAQFPFRFWSIVGFFIIILLAYILKPLAKFSKYLGPITIGLSCFLLTLNMGIVDKRLYSLPSTNPGYYEVDENWIKENIREFGAQNEYLPQIIYDIYQGNVEASYENSLAVDVGRIVVNKRTMLYDIEEYITPVYLEGSGEVTITYLNTPDVNFDIICYEDGLLQIPQFYYDGYNAIARFDDGTTQKLEISNVDGLVAISVIEGEYTLEITYPGSTLKNVGWGVLCVSIVGVISFGIYGIIYDKKSKKSKDLQ